ncbi:PucR family transcriptional regulator [Lentzea jiangxiensis]|uniref:PucR C-terminal helix-turn-helix domain-containing protein n=1 Tax=Lentzea jiangxiensis TaxID=641025 RepID=A0A1H0SNG0_9PSEU|nr:PucR family transcriptional regulator [Lentzea jiangxiensis]SDP43205.1 PucR C-terminal helix-turn-helix domain-containing protein [Lentzea jiangxiensis]
MPEPIEAQLAMMATELSQQADELVAGQLRVIGAIGSYRVVPPSEIRPSAHRNVLRVVSALRGEDHLSAGVAADERETGRRRALQGIPSADVLTAYRSCIALLRDEFLRLAQAEAIPADAVLLGTQQIWQLGDHYSSEFLDGHREAELDLTRRAEQQQTILLARLLKGTMTTDQVVAAGIGFGFAVDKHYWVLRARSDSTDPVALSNRMRRAAGEQDTALVGTYGGDVAAVLSRPITGELTDDVTIGLAGPTGLSQLRTGFAEATQLLEVATRFGHRGIVDHSRMALRLAVAKEPELGKQLHARYVEPVEAESAIGEVLLASVETYLTRRRSIPEAATALSVHVNTLRYRLERFAMLTGADLQDTDTMFEVWWALQYRILCESPT